MICADHQCPECLIDFVHDVAPGQVCIDVVRNVKSGKKVMRLCGSVCFAVRTARYISQQNAREDFHDAI